MVSWVGKQAEVEVGGVDVGLGGLGGQVLLSALLGGEGGGEW